MHLKKGNTKVFLFGLAFVSSIFSTFLSAAFSQTINSRSAILLDTSTERILYAKEPERRLPPASTAKLMTAIVVMEKADLSDGVIISKNASQVRPSKVGFEKGDKVTVEKLLYAALVASGNDAAVALAEAVAGSEEHFVHLMNEKAISIGAKDTKFINSTGLPGDHQYTTALDLSKIMRCALSYSKIKEIMGTSTVELLTEKGKILVLKNTDELLWSNENLIGGKTGYTLRGGHCFVCAAERENQEIIVVLLGSSSRRRLWKETETLIDKGFQIIEDKKSL
jgi:D-alanyl-D-alanine carboxypeptidase (penicillin-binding protein 5/6)